MSMKSPKYFLIAFCFLGFAQVMAQTMTEYEDFLKAGVKLSTKELVYAQL